MNVFLWSYRADVQCLERTEPHMGSASDEVARWRKEEDYLVSATSDFGDATRDLQIMLSAGNVEDIQIRSLMLCNGRLALAPSALAAIREKPVRERTLAEEGELFSDLEVGTRFIYEGMSYRKVSQTVGIALFNAAAPTVQPLPGTRVALDDEQDINAGDDDGTQSRQSETKR